MNMAKLDGAQHAKKMPRIRFYLLITLTIAVASGVLGFVFLSMGKMPGGASRVHGEVVGVAGTTGVLYQKELEASEGSLRACAAIDVGAVTTKDDGDETSTSGIGGEYGSAFSKELATGSTLERASAAVGAAHDVYLACVRGEVETSNERFLQLCTNSMVRAPVTTSSAPSRVDPGESMPCAASDDWFIVKVAIVSAIVCASKRAGHKVIG